VKTRGRDIALDEAARSIIVFYGVLFFALAAGISFEWVLAASAAGALIAFGLGAWLRLRGHTLEMPLRNWATLGALVWVVGLLVILFRLVTGRDTVAEAAVLAAAFTPGVVLLTLAVRWAASRKHTSAEDSTGVRLIGGILFFITALTVVASVVIVLVKQ
jgi:formate/nitrite transporter FocA (FNT family)